MSSGLSNTVVFSLRGHRTRKTVRKDAVEGVPGMTDVPRLEHADDRDDRKNADEDDI